MSIKRIYSYRDSEMLLTAKTIAQMFRENIGNLTNIRTNWTPEYAEELSSRIDEIIDTHLGARNKKELHEATEALRKLASAALKELTALRIFLTYRYKHEAGELLYSMGYKTHYQKARRYKSTEALAANLVAINTGMTEKWRERLASDGFSPEYFERFSKYSRAIIDGNANQEVLKQTTKKNTANAIQSYNNIYSEIISICRTMFLNQSLDRKYREQFSFSRIAGNMSRSQGSNQEDSPL